jgi:competence protein ComEA
MAGRSGRRGEPDPTVARRLALLRAELDAARDARRPVLDTRPQSGPLPAPGRHAAPGRLALGTGQLTVVVVLVVVALGVGAWWLASGDDPEIAAMGPTPVGDLVSTSAGPSSGSTNVEGAGSVTVDVAGKVRRPGIAVLESGARVIDALEAAGGARPGVDLTSLNLARVLVDGEQILVGIELPAGVAPSAAGTGAPVASLVNLNTADQVALETLPGVGPVTAQSILAWRTEHGAFTSVDQLLDVDGIGEATLAKLTPYVTL